MVQGVSNPDTVSPILVYHGTGEAPAAFTGFSLWGAVDPALANEYAAMRHHGGGAGQVHPIYLKIRQPLDGDALPRTVTIRSFVEGAASQALAHGRSVPEETLSEITARLTRAARTEESGPHYSRQDFWYRLRTHFGQDGAAAIEELFGLLGFDGVRMTEQGIVSYGVFTPEQASSALTGRPYFASPVNEEQESSRSFDGLLTEPGFRSWFGNSAVVDEDGQPKPVFHGTKARFEAFSTPAWFTPRFEFADLFSADWGEDGERDARSRVVTAYLSIQNPILTDDWDVTEGKAFDPDWRAEQLANGFDGVIFQREETPGELEVEYIAFLPEQIKIVDHGYQPAQAVPDPAPDTEMRLSAAYAAPAPTEPRLRDCFTGSVLADGQGRPVVLYHGSSSTFSEFESRHHVGDGIYFSTDPQYASNYAEARASLSGAATVYPAHLAIRQPLELLGDRAADWERYTQRGFDTRELAAQGYDGVVMRYADGEIEAMVFHPWQIRSAVGYDTSPAPGAVPVVAYANPARLVPADLSDDPEAAADGEWILDGGIGLYGQGVALVRDLPLSDLYLPELENGEIAPEKRRFMPEYIERARAGERPPAIRVIEMESGRLRVTDGHRRVLAALAAGQTHLRAVLSPLVDTPEGKKPATADLINLYGYGDSAHLAPSAKQPVASMQDLAGNMDDIPPASGTPPSPAFERWFAGSQVVTDTGEPLVVYNGANYEWVGDAFAVDATMEGGAFFSASREVANHFADPVANGAGGDPDDEAPHVTPAYLSIRNPKRLRAEDILDQHGDHSFDIMRRAILAAKAAGHDGLFIADVPDGDLVADQWVAFESTQIKSAIGNVGSYSPANPDMRYAAGYAAPAPENSDDWFAGSQIVRDSGEPLRVFHATNRLFTRFDRAFLGSNTGWTNTELGFFFIAERELAKNFGEETSGGRFIIEAELAIKKPLYLLVPDIFNRIDQAATIYEITSGERVSPEEALEALNDEIDLAELPELLQAVATEEGRAIMARDGFDGVVSEFGAGHVEYVAFDPDQVRIISIEDLQPPGHRPDPEFSAWFGSSHVVDDNGLPRLVFHGTPATGIQQFDRTHALTRGDGRRPSIDQIGVWTTSVVGDTWRGGARRYGPNVMPLHLRIERPLELADHRELMRMWDQFHWSAKEMRHAGLDEVRIARARELHEQNPSWGDADGFIASLQSAGYDGIIIRSWDGDRYDDNDLSLDLFIAFEPDQIRVVSDLSPAGRALAGGPVPAEPPTLALPEVVYHGSPVPDIEAFEAGTFFTENPKLAEGYGQHVYVARLAVSNPATGRDVIRVAQGLPGWSDDQFADEYPGIIFNQVPGVMAALAEQGFDSAFFDDGPSANDPDDTEDSPTWVIFRPDQAELAPELAFERWFAGSQVVTDNGEPMVVYHGTTRGMFSEFQLNKITRSNGFVFTSDRNVALTYSGQDNSAEPGQRNPTKSGVYEVYLSLKNPKIVDWKGADSGDNGGTDAAIQNARDEGYDGIIMRNVDDAGIYKGMMENRGKIPPGTGVSDLYVAFSPEQIKSAAGNAGRYSPANPDIRYATGYHGTHARFEQFSLDAIGTGEGRHVYGWGLYFADKEAVAKWYCENLSPDRHFTKFISIETVTYHVEHEEPDSPAAALEVAKAALALMINDDTLEEMTDEGFDTSRVAAFQEALLSDPDLGRLLFELSEATIAHDWERWRVLQDDIWVLFERAATSVIEARGLIYEAQIPDAEHLLDWDAPLSAQPPAVVAALERMRSDTLEGVTCAEALLADCTGGEFYDLLSRNLEGVSNPSRAASELLGRAGIPGLRFLDALSRDARQGSHNYVIWDDQAVSVLGRQASPPPETRHAAAYHGSPHAFDQFRLDALGTGEGGQAFAWGLYFTATREIAESYRDALSKQVFYKGLRVAELGIPTESARLAAIHDVARAVSAGEDPAASISASAKGWEAEAELYRAAAAEAKAGGDLALYRGAVNTARSFEEIARAIRQLDPADFRRHPGYLYEVDLPPDAALLDWDAPLTEQSPAVRQTLAAIDPDLWQWIEAKAPHVAALQDASPDQKTRVELDMVAALASAPLPVSKIPTTGAQFYNLLADEYGAQGAAEFLDSYGLPGARYLDGFSRRAHGLPPAGSENHNYVIWNESVIRVMRTLGETMTPTPARAATRFSLAHSSSARSPFEDWFGNSHVVDHTGAPLRVFHGTQASFNEFDAERYGQSVSGRGGDLGFFFINDPAAASAHAMADWWRDDPRPNVMPVYLSVQDPLVYAGIAEPARWYDEHGREASLKALAEGKDGLIIGDDIKLYVVFDRTQIKSAIGNIGTYSRRSADIRLSATAAASGGPDFKEWFSDSQVVDDHGLPKVLYHGSIVQQTRSGATVGDIAQFDRLASVNLVGRPHSIDTVGSWFSTNPGPGGAGMYAGATGDNVFPGAVIYPVYLSIQRPYRTTYKQMLRRARLLASGEDDGRMIGQAEVEALRRWLLATGRDGIHLTDADPFEREHELADQDVWIALHPEQIRSAINHPLQPTRSQPPLRHRLGRPVRHNAGQIRPTINTGELEARGETRFMSARHGLVTLREELVPEHRFETKVIMKPAVKIISDGAARVVPADDTDRLVRAIFPSGTTPPRQALLAISMAVARMVEHGSTDAVTVPVGDTEFTLAPTTARTVVRQPVPTGQQRLALAAYDSRGNHLGSYQGMDGVTRTFGANPAAPNMPVEAVKAVLAGSEYSELVSGLLESGDLTVHADYRSMPGGRPYARAQTTPEGRIHLNAGALSEDLVVPTLMHEAFHRSDGLFGTKAWKVLLNELEALYLRQDAARPEDAVWWAEARRHVARARSLGAPMSWAIEVEEFGAYALQAYASAPSSVKSWVDRALGTVKAWGLRVFGKQFGKVTPAQLAAMAKMALADRANCPEATRGSAPASALQRNAVAYHGSPEAFSAFNLEYVGTGEGNANYGWGLYFAGEREVAEFYRASLSRHRTSLSPAIGWTTHYYRIDGEPVLSGDDRFRAASIVDWINEHSVTDPKRIKEEVWLRYGAAVADVSELLAQINSMKNAEVERVNTAGSLLTVTVPDNEHLLDWDVPLYMQPESVRRALVLAGLVDGEIITEYKYPGMHLWTTHRIPDADCEQRERADVSSTGTGEMLYAALSRKHGGDQAASQVLNAIGISGHRYLDQWSRAGQIFTRTWNYVIWDDQVVRIDAINDEPLLRFPDDERTMRFAAGYEGQTRALEDADGNPVTAYHGAARQPGELDERGMYLSLDRGYAENTARVNAMAAAELGHRDSGPGHVLCARLHLSNPAIRDEAFLDRVGYDAELVNQLLADGHDGVMTADGSEIYVFNAKLHVSPIAWEPVTHRPPAVDDNLAPSP